MNSNVFRMPARRLAAATAATALAAGPALLATAGPAHATDHHGGGKAGAVVLRTGLDVSLLNKTVDVPLTVSLNDVQAPASADRTALTAEVKGVDRGRPFSVLRADVASAKAVVDADRAEGTTRLVHARVHVPGLPLLSLIEVDQVTAKALCEAGRRPVAEANVLGAVTVLGKRVTLSAGGPTEVKVPGVGEVTLNLSQHTTTSHSAAASALELKVSVNPLKLNVADVEGTVTLAKATCEAPAAPEAPAPAASAPAAPVDDVKPRSGADPEPAKDNLAETGGSSVTPYLAAGSVALLVAGAAVLARSRRRNQS
ncbi:SCO1860 family LAETG-anchored protein [Streptomyces sp. NPDC002004]